MKLPILYKYNEKGKAQQWQIIVEGKEFYTEDGLVGGKIKKSKPTLCEPKNVGRSNELTAEEQAVKEATSKWNKKKSDKGYNEKIELSGKKYRSPMLAEDYRDKGTMITHKWVEEIMKDKTILKVVQPKLDGLRSINENNTLMSREGKPFVTCPHLYQNEVVLDGELYNHLYKDDFNAVVSMIKQPKGSAEAIANAAKYAEMWVYDMPAVEGPFMKRYETLKQWVKTCGNPMIKLVPTYVIKNEDDLKKRHKEFKDLGFEGTMIRISKDNYENKRSTQLIKYKDFIDEEFLIVGYVEGKGGRKGTIGKFILQHDKNPSQTFKSNVKGNFDYLKEIWKNRDSYIGKEATVEYHNRTPKSKKGGDVPRFGYIIKIDRKSYE